MSAVFAVRRSWVGGVLLTMVDGRTRLAADVEAEVRRHFGELVFRTSVPRSVRLAEAPSHKKTIFEYAPISHGAADYNRVCDWVLATSAHTESSLHPEPGAPIAA